MRNNDMQPQDYVDFLEKFYEALDARNKQVPREPDIEPLEPAIIERIENVKYALEELYSAIPSIKVDIRNKVWEALRHIQDTQEYYVAQEYYKNIEED